MDLRRAPEFRKYTDDPGHLAREIRQHDSVPFVVIDEVQNVPELLDEVHWMHENLGVRFGLCGSSTREVRRGRANLLGVQ